MFKNDNNYEIQIYERYTPKLKSVIKDPADTKIYIMDIEIQGDKSGLDIGREVRKTIGIAKYYSLLTMIKCMIPYMKAYLKYFAL